MLIENFVFDLSLLIRSSSSDFKLGYLKLRYESDVI